MDRDNQKLWVVGIGSSAGGLEALQSFVSNLPQDLEAAIIVAQHLAPLAKSMLVELLSRHSTWPVAVAHHGEKLRAGQIYIVPPNHDVDLSDGRLFLHKAGSETRPKPSVDTFFHSLARTWGTHAVGIILSGTGSDGTQGIQAVQAAGGLTLAQDDDSARYDGMPKSAADSGGVKAILAPELMARDLGALMSEHERRREHLKLGETGWINQILELLKNQTGLNFANYKMPTIRRRIEKHMSQSHYEAPEDYVTFLQNRPGELEALSQELFINVTSFFRDPEAYAVLVAAIEKPLLAKVAAGEFRVWVAGCATGEEAYTLAIVLSELLTKHAKHLRLRIFATDLDQEALVEARNGIYSAAELESMDSVLRERYFHRHGDKFEADRALREMIVFARQDLGQSPPFVKIDLITCRNVMIYFGNPLQKRILEIFHYALVPDGVLFLGKSESLSECANLFETIDRKAKVYRKLNVVNHSHPGHLYSGRTSAVTGKRAPATLSPVAELAQKEVLARFEVAGVVIDEGYNLLHVIGNVSRFVNYPEGQATLSLPQILPKNAGSELPILVKKVQNSGEAHRSRLYPLGDSKARETFQLNVRPLGASENNRAVLFLVLFEQRKSRKVSTTVPAGTDADNSVRVLALEQELAETREQLQTLIEELGVSNEELQSLNEELNSTNEELQSTNEELETTNEELQSTNEELSTLNEELGVKSAELRQINLNLENIQNSIGTPLIVVDGQMRVLRFNNTATRIFDISTADLGRDITRLSAHCEIPDFHEHLTDTLDTGHVSEVVVERMETVYQLRILPSLDEHRRANGAILIFIDNSQLLRAEDKLRDSEQRIRAIIDSSPSLISLKDTLGRYLVVNAAFSEFFGMRTPDVIGKTDRELFDGDLAAQLRDADLDVFYKKVGTRRDEELKPGHHFTIGRFPLVLEPGGQPYAVGMVGIDVSERVRIEDELSRSEARYRSIVEDQAVLIARFDPRANLLYVNNSFTIYFGGVADNYRRKSFLDLLDEADRERIAVEFGRLGTQSPVVHLEHRIMRFGNQARWLRWILKAVIGPTGSIEEIQGVGIDVTESRGEADRLQERETVFSHIFSYTTDYLTVFRVTPENEFFVESFNPSAEHAMGYSFTHLVGRNLRSLVEATKVDAYMQHFDDCVSTMKPQVLEEELRTPGGTKYLLTTLVPISNLQGKIERIASMSRDVSSFKTIEDELRAEKERAEEASRAKSDFLASMSHELRTPLNVVLGMAQLLADSKIGAEEQRFVSTIDRSGKVLLALIEDVLDLSKVEEGLLRLETSSFDLRDVIADVEDSFFTHTNAKDLVFKTHVGFSVPPQLMGDAGRLRQVLVNLVGNAIKFTDTGSITLQVENEESGQPGIEQLFFRVTDTGIGIKEDQKHRLFQKFSQADSGSARRYGGTGLGLVICKRLVELMGGEIGFESKFGDGSVFWFRVRIPLAHSPTVEKRKAAKALAKSKSEAIEAHNKAHGKALRILAVEDNPDSQEFIQLLLSSMGHSVQTASSGAEAVVKVKADHFDVVLMDVQMPEQDGYQTTQKIRQLDSAANKVPIIALTANAMSGDADKCREAGMDAYLSKPVQKEALRKMLAKWSPRESELN